jgi:hypothetical protein
MSAQVWLVFFFTFVVHLIGTLSYALRIAGARTGKIALSLSLFNIFALASRAAHSFQVPLLAKHVEENIQAGATAGAEADFRWLLLAGTLATALGALLIPTSQRLLTGAVEAYDARRSLPRLMLRALSPAGLRRAAAARALPARRNLALAADFRRVPASITLANVAATGLLSVGAFASLYAGYLDPALRVTANFSTVLLFVFVDPYLSLLTDDAAGGRVSQTRLRACVVIFVAGRLAGTLLAQIIFVPSALVIARAAQAL